MALGAGTTVGILLPFSRQHEYEADRLGVTYMANGWLRSSRIDKTLFGSVLPMGPALKKPPEFFSTHPSDANRIAKLQERMANYLAVYQQAPQQHGTGSQIAQRYRGT